MGWLLSETPVGDTWNKVITKPASALKEPVCSAAQLSSSRLLPLQHRFNLGNQESPSPLLKMLFSLNKKAVYFLAGLLICLI